MIFAIPEKGCNKGFIITISSLLRLHKFNLLFLNLEAGIQTTMFIAEIYYFCRL